MPSSDIKAKYCTGTGSLGIQSPARIRGIHIHAGGSNTNKVVITAGNGGAEKITIDLHHNDSHSVTIPADGILIEDAYVLTFTNVVSMTVFYA